MRLGSFDAAGAAAGELVERAVELERLRTRLDAEQSTVLAELEHRKTCDRVHGLHTPAWLAREANLPSGVARERVRVASKLRRHFQDMAAAVADGRIGWEHARTIVQLANPRIVDVVAENQELLLALADRCRFEVWRNEVRGLCALWDQDGGYDPNEDPEGTSARYAETLDGAIRMVATLTGQDAVVFKQVLDAITDELFKQAVADEKECPDLKAPPRHVLQGRALTEMARRAVAVDLGSSKPAKVEATMVVDASEPTTATDPDGVPLADGSTRVLLCDAIFHSVILNALGVPLDLGRGVRFAEEAQRRAVRRRDGGCAFPGCDAKLAWCDVHHCVHWEHGGVSDLCNLVSLCRHHHGVVHRKGWSVHLTADGWAVFRSASGLTFWGQRHGRRHEGPPPDLPPPDTRC